MSQLLKVAVVGAGHLGKWHADKYAAAADCELVAVVDTNQEVAREIASKHGAESCLDYREILGRVDAISLVVPTSAHYKIAREFLEAGIHCLIEKPITETVAEAEELIEIAARRQLVLQVGHIERFNSVMLGIAEQLHEPQFIESTRLAPLPAKRAGKSRRCPRTCRPLRAESSAGSSSSFLRSDGSRVAWFSSSVRHPAAMPQSTASGPHQQVRANRMFRALHLLAQEGGS